MLQTLFDKNVLPKFSNEFVKFKIAAIDPQTEDILGLPESCTPEQQAHVEARLAAGTLLYADVYLARRLRQDTIATFLNALITIFDREAPKTSASA